MKNYNIDYNRTYAVNFTELIKSRFEVSSTICQSRQHSSKSNI
jgi:hypothetical protein